MATDSGRVDASAPAPGREPPVIVVGTAHPRLGRALAARTGSPCSQASVESFPDGELHVTVDERVRHRWVCVVQPTGPPVERRLLELLFLVDACHRAGARRVTAVVPYFGYARQDRRTVPGEAVALRVLTDVLAAVHIDEIVVVDPHPPTFEAIASVPVMILSAVPVLAAALGTRLPASPVLVAPDLGAVKLAERYASRLHLPVAVVRKRRLSGTRVESSEVVGEVEDRTPVVVDDMISTGATIVAATQALRAAGARTGITVVATHGVFAADAARDLAGLDLERLLVTDSLTPSGDWPDHVDVVGIDRLLGDALTLLGGASSRSPLLAGEP